MWLFLLVLIQISLVYSNYETLTKEPIVGIFMLPSSSKQHPVEEYSQIPASYVKYIEMAGARVVPIHYDADQKYYDDIFEKINGLLFTGGGTYFEKGSQVGDNGFYLFQKAIQAKNSGVHFPVWGTCLGFEMLMKFAANFADVIGDIAQQDDVTRTIEVLYLGELFGQMPKEILFNSQNYGLQYYHHSHDVTPQTFYSNEDLKNFYHLSATSQNDDKVVFIAAVEAKNYPIFGTQFHPEKNSFEWRVNANHTVEAIEMGQYYANFFVQNARMNSHQFQDKQELDNLLIYNYKPVYMPPSSKFEQTYYFENFAKQNFGRNEHIIYQVNFYD